MALGRFTRRPNMHAGNIQRRHRPDYSLLMISVGLLVIGLIVIYAISPGLVAQKHVSDNYFISKQLIAIVLGIISFTVTANVPMNVWRKLQKQLLATVLIATIAVRVFGEEVNGAYRWLQVGGLSFQAVELTKFVLVVWLASFLATKISRNELDDNQATFKPLILLLAIISTIVAIVQSDLGSAMVLIAMIFSMCFVAGLPLKRVFIIGIVIFVGGCLLISTSAYRRNRFLTYIHPQRDCQNAGYQACQALITVGSGGLFGKGFANDAQAYGYLPESANDSIFAIMGEKFGFVGLVSLLALFGLFFLKLKAILVRTPDDYSRFVVVGVIAWIGAQSLINIGAMIGMMPLKGITLPFISYGGTSVVFVTAAVGLAFNISRYTTYTKSLQREGDSHDDIGQRRGDRRTHHAYLSRRK